MEIQPALKLSSVSETLGAIAKVILVLITVQPYSLEGPSLVFTGWSLIGAFEHLIVRQIGDPGWHTNNSHRKTWP